MTYTYFAQIRKSTKNKTWEAVLPDFGAECTCCHSFEEAVDLITGILGSKVKEILQKGQYLPNVTYPADYAKVKGMYWVAVRYETSYASTRCNLVGRSEALLTKVLCAVFEASTYDDDALRGSNCEILIKDLSVVIGSWLRGDVTQEDPVIVLKTRIRAFLANK